MLYKTVIERMLAYGAAVWCLDPPVRIKRKLNHPKTITACSYRSIQNNSNLDTPGHTWNSTSLPPAPAGGQSHSHSKTTVAEVVVVVYVAHIRRRCCMNKTIYLTQATILKTVCHDASGCQGKPMDSKTWVKRTSITEGTV
ncbi:hypothetical protein AVEN_207231-1 [Araneus ventricosus]|uniref:Uncharacterized protein n=1 Tax=Araneus ventricosus TaxID=182803 RepID=A0A4Y2I9D6_ARAVE|nr:hypothetical protein AVEN_207231-1 [Araneus ventricosus]